MRAGAMRYRLKVFKPVKGISGFGSEKSEYECFGVINAERVKLTGQQSMEVGEEFADYRADFNIRDAHKVKSGWRVLQLGGNLYEVANVIPNIDRGMLTLQCVRVNE